MTVESEPPLGYDKIATVELTLFCFALVSVDVDGWTANLNVFPRNS